MAITEERFKCDGSNRIFTPTTKIISINHVRVDYCYEDNLNKTYYVVPSEWDLINNSIVFKEAPESTKLIIVSVSTTGEDINEPLSAVQMVAFLKDDVITVARNVEGIQKYYDTYLGVHIVPPTKRSDYTPLKLGDFYFNANTNNMEVYTEGGWENVAGNSVNYLGDYDNEKTYYKNDLVRLDGYLYLSLVDDNSDELVNNDKWLNIARIPIVSNLDESNDGDNIKVSFKYLCDTSNAAFKIVLPDDANKGDIIEVIDLKKTFNDNNLTLDRNGNLIDNEDANYICDIVGKYEITCIDDEGNWRVTNG